MKLRSWLLATAGAGLLGLGSWAAPALASVASPQAQVCTSGSCSYDYATYSNGTWYGWSGVASQDTACDNTGVYANYYRDSGGKQGLNNYNGCNTETRSGSDIGNLINHHRSCTNYTGPDSCSSYVYR